MPRRWDRNRSTVATVAACFVAAGFLRGSSATLALAAALCFAAMLAITLIGNMPLNVRVLAPPVDYAGACQTASV